MFTALGHHPLHGYGRRHDDGPRRSRLREQERTSNVRRHVHRHSNFRAAW